MTRFVKTLNGYFSDKKGGTKGYQKDTTLYFDPILWYNDDNKEAMIMYKRKTTKSIFVELDNASYNAIKKLSLISGKAMSQTAFMLINTAAAYNFTSDGEYTCCKLKRSEPIFNIDKAGKPTYPHEITLCTSDSTFEKFDRLKEVLCCASYSETARTLIHIALDYDYDDKLMFSKPEQVSFSECGKSGGKDIIMLDII